MRINSKICIISFKTSFRYINASVHGTFKNTICDATMPQNRIFLYMYFYLYVELDKKIIYLCSFGMSENGN